jgi:hypothetical protein
MSNWNYFELIAIYYRSYFGLINQGELLSNANNRNINDFWFLPNEENLLANLITIIQYINIEVSVSKFVSKSANDIFTKQLTLIDEKLINQFLSEKEKEHLLEGIDDLKMKIKQFH